MGTTYLTSHACNLSTTPPFGHPFARRRGRRGEVVSESTYEKLGSYPFYSTNAILFVRFVWFVVKFIKLLNFLTTNHTNQHEKRNMEEARMGLWS